MITYLDKSEEYPEDGNWMFRVESYPSGVIRYDAYKVVSITPKGVWVIPRYVREDNEEDVKLFRKFILKDGKKRFAYETREQARLAFLFRKRRQIEILNSQLARAGEAYCAAGGTLPVMTRTFRYYEDY